MSAPQFGRRPSEGWVEPDGLRGTCSWAGLGVDGNGGYGNRRYDNSSLQASRVTRANADRGRPIMSQPVGTSSQ